MMIFVENANETETETESESVKANIKAKETAKGKAKLLKERVLAKSANLIVLSLDLLV